MLKRKTFSEYDAKAPMWMDFESSGNISSDYFDTFHPENETPFPDAPDKLRAKTNDCPDVSSIFESHQPKPNATSTSQLTSNFMETLDTINMTPVKVVSPTNKNGKSTVLKETTVEEVLNDVIGIASSAVKQKRRALNLNKSQSTNPESCTTPLKPRRITRSMYSAESKKTPAAHKTVVNLRKSTLSQRATPVKSSVPDDAPTNDAGVPISKIIRTPILKLTKINPAILTDMKIPAINFDADNEPPNDNDDQEVDKDETIKPEELEEILEVHPLNPMPPESSAKLIASTPAPKPIHSKQPEKPISIPLEAIKPVPSAPVVPSTCHQPKECAVASHSEVETAMDPQEFPPATADNPDEEEYEEVFEHVEDFEHYPVHKAYFVEKRKNNHQPSVLTSHARRRSSIIMKNRRQSNRYVSLAEAIVKFQRSTPTRFRSISAKNPKPKSLQTVKQMAKKPVVPVSPALSSKNRVRRNVVLSRAELEEIEVQKMRQHQIRANPVPKSILQAPQQLKAVPKKSMTLQRPFHLGIPKKTGATRQPSSSTSSAGEHHAASKKPHKVTVPIVVASENGVTISESQIMHFGIPVNQNETSGLTRKKKTTQPLPFNFEQRNKSFMDKKEEKLKKLQNEESKGKTEFHARPIPLSSKKAPKKEQPNKKEQDEQRAKAEIHKLRVIPFSFEERNKVLLKKKEELRKKIEQEEKKARVFHANPAPQFKPVMVKGTSRENLKNNEKNPVPVVSRARSRENVKSDGKNPPMIRNRSAETFKAPVKPTTRGLSAENLRVRANSKENFKVKPQRKASAPELLDHTDGNEENRAPNDNENKKIRSNSSSSLSSNMPVLKPKLKSLPVELHSDKRARLRREYDEQIKMKITLGEEKRRREQEERLAREQSEIHKLRKQAEIKARPMPVYKPMAIVKSNKPLTAPESPAWSHKR